jgi:hypothetical protein
MEGPLSLQAKASPNPLVNADARVGGRQPVTGNDGPMAALPRPEGFSDPFRNVQVEVL